MRPCTRSRRRSYVICPTVTLSGSTPRSSAVNCRRSRLRNTWGWSLNNGSAVSRAWDRCLRSSGMELKPATGPQIVYDGEVTREDLGIWNSELEGLFARMGRLFYRTESRRHAEQYVRGLLAPIQRKNGWTIAEYVGEAEPKALQRFLNVSPWDVDKLLELNRDYVMEHLASPAAILVADPTGFAKKGTKSVGVQRQYSGTLGRIDNCQIATFLAYVTPDRDRVLIDRRLYLPTRPQQVEYRRGARGQTV